jgi:predicted DsbA family dithiol-disulfide isomerase
MAISQVLCTSFKKELLEATHNFGSHEFRIALYTNAATLNADTTVYSTDNEVSGTGYDAGTKVITASTVASGDGVGFVNFSDAAWASSSFTARGALIYNATQGNKAVMVLDFGDDKTSNNSTFTVAMPANTSTAALIRIT